jgi:hypothetical protein
MEGRRLTRSRPSVRATAMRTVTPSRARSATGGSTSAPFPRPRGLRAAATKSARRTCAIGSSTRARRRAQSARRVVETRSARTGCATTSSSSAVRSMLRPSRADATRNASAATAPWRPLRAGDGDLEDAVMTVRARDGSRASCGGSYLTVRKPSRSRRLAIPSNHAALIVMPVTRTTVRGFESGVGPGSMLDGHRPALRGYERTEPPSGTNLRDQAAPTSPARGAKYAARPIRRSASRTARGSRGRLRDVGATSPEISTVTG